jgi:hypothetical protein
MKRFARVVTKKGLRRVLFVFVCVLVAGLTRPVIRGQGQLTNSLDWNDGLRYLRGQDVVPAFEGWVANPDGTFSLVFGYFNRNWEEELYIPVGPNNHIDPGGPDRGQPTVFGPRRGKNLFEIVVPKDFGKSEVVWTLTSHGKTEKAYGALVPPEVLTRRMVWAGGALQENANAGNDDTGNERDPNRPPSVTLESVAPVQLPAKATLTASVTDDGLPTPETVRGGGRGGFRGLRVTWVEYRGPAKVTFDPPVSRLQALTGGKATTTVTFRNPGTYVLRALAADAGNLEQFANVTVTVNGGTATAQR